jgi:hypothetical protein
LRSGIRATSAAESRKVTAFTAYGTDGPQTAKRKAPATGPTVIASVSTVTVSEFAFASSSSGTRFGIAGIGGREEEARGDSRHRREHDEACRAVDERKCREDAKTSEIGDDHQPAAREPVDERTEQEPDEDDRQEVGDEERRDPLPGLRQLLDLKHESDGREIGAEARAGGREEEVPERR